MEQKVSTITQIRKRDGRLVEFNQEKITNAIFKAVIAVGGSDRERAKSLSDKVVETLEEKYHGHTIPTVENIQDIVEKVLIENGHAKTAKAYILYRQERKNLREAKALFYGVTDDLKLTLNAIKVLEKRYLLKDENGKVVETPRQLFERVASSIAAADKLYDPNADVEKTKRKFLRMLTKLEFLPNSPTLMNAGTKLGQLSACFVLPVGDSMEEIFEALKQTALIHKSGGGTGFSFSRLRPSEDIVMSTGGIASGPISFMRVFDSATDVIKQGGKRRGANMGVLRVDHPNILDFITCKERDSSINNFNISVALTEKFMEAVNKDEEYELFNPRSKKVVKKLSARDVFNLIITMAYKNGDPGIIFIDRINKDNPTPQIGEIESTNPCGEQPLLPYESCNLGSINLSKMVEYGQIDWDKLRETVRTAVHFLDNVVDINKLPIPEIGEMTLRTRKIGLGVMGFADMLIEVGVPYDSDEAVVLAEKIMKFITDEARQKSRELGEIRGSFPTFKGSIWDKDGSTAMRNATVTTIAPTGTIGVIAGCSSGIEPLFAISYVRNVLESLGTDLIETNPLFKRIAQREGFYTPELMMEIVKKGSIREIKEIPEIVRKVFVTAHDITPEWHLKMQAAFQKYTDNAVSKTVNFPNNATPDDIENVYRLAYELECKGVTVYRDGSRDVQVLNVQREEPEKVVPAKIEPKPDDAAVKVGSSYSGGCSNCSIS